MSARRWIVLLAVMHLVVLGWWWLRPEAASVTQTPAAADVPRLRLMGEPGAAPPAAATPVQAAPLLPSPPAPTPAPTETAATAEDAATATQCFTLGPYAQEDVLTRARMQLAGAGRQITLRREAVSAQGFTVSLPPQGSAEAAKATAERLRAAGFDDLFVMAGSNGIALGRFSSEERAQARQASLRAAGFSAQIQPVGGAAGERLWLDVQAPGETAAAVRAAANGAPVRQRACRAG